MKDETKTKYFLVMRFTDGHAETSAFESDPMKAILMYQEKVMYGDNNRGVRYVALYQGVPYSEESVLLETCQWIGRKIK